MNFALAPFLVTVSAALFLGDVRGASFERYAVILDRQPFGEPAAPEPLPEVRAQAPVPPPFVKDLRLHVLRDRGGEIRVGFMDMAAKPPKSYFLRVGESEDGISVLDVDFEKGRVKLAKGTDNHWLSMDGKADTPAVERVTDTPPPRLAGNTASDSGASDAENSARNLSFIERLRQRREALRKRQEADAAAAASRAVSGDARSELEKLRDVQKAILESRGGVAPASRARPSAVEEP